MRFFFNGCEFDSDAMTLVGGGPNGLPVYVSADHRYVLEVTGRRGKSIGFRQISGLRLIQLAKTQPHPALVKAARHELRRAPLTP